jgi:exodeoxyribonuclease V alpha subunit
VHQVAATLEPADRARIGTPTASTLHRLLGSLPGQGTRFRHHRDNRLPYDVVVVDETSMVSLTLMARLIEAIRPDARLVLVGDPDQLASVEAGAVLADLVSGLTGRAAAASARRAVEAVLPVPPPANGSWQQGVVLLGRIWRFGGAIAELAAAVRTGDADAATAILRAGSPDVVFADTDADPDVGGAERRVADEVVGAAAAVRVAAERGDAADALALLTEHRLLCAHRAGPYGVDTWSRTIDGWLAESALSAPLGEWYVGRPLLVTANDYGLGLFNGDTGVVVRADDGSVRVAFPRAHSHVTFAPSRLSGVQTVHAMTVHRSQGSQFRRVTLVVPPEDSPLLTRELLYTALTRARERVRVVGTEAALRAAIARPAARASGLRERLSAAAATG